MSRPVAVEALCAVMHDAYEQAAVGAGWETNPASRKSWVDVPHANQDTMRAAVSAALAFIRDALHRDGDDASAIREALALSWQYRQGHPGRRVVSDWEDITSDRAIALLRERLTAAPQQPPMPDVECCASGSCEVCRPGRGWS